MSIWIPSARLLLTSLAINDSPHFAAGRGGFGLRECSEEGELYPMALDGGAKV
jgi:hypothetical protein